MNLAIIGASYLQLPLILKAKEMGYTTHVFAWAANDIGEKAADYFYPISIIEMDKITEECRRIGIVGICSIATDLGNFTVNYVANALGLPGNSMECARLSTNKYLMRQAFRHCGDPSPQSILVDSNTDFSLIELHYPVIIKPTDRSGSRGIFKLENSAGLERAVESAINSGFEKKALIEEFVEGQEFSVEGISFQGNHRILAVTQKYTTGAPNFIETGHMEPAPISTEMYEKIEKVIIHALDSLKVKNSASHSEIKIDQDGNIKIIEIASRMGGDCIGSDLVEYSTGIDYVKATIQVACGIEPELSIKEPKGAVEVRYIFNNEDIIEMKRYEKEKKIIRIADLNLKNIGQITDSSNRGGCYIRKI